VQNVSPPFPPWTTGFRDTNERYWGADPLEDILSFLLTIGSPTLAAYSLQITQLNSRWINQVFSDIDYPNSDTIPVAISALQHIPVQLSSNPTLLPSLIILPQNDGYWRLLHKSARKIRRWSIPLVMNFAWVVIAAVLTIVDSFYRPTPGEIGYGTVTSLAYLLPLIIGWLHVGSEPEPNHLKDSLEDAGRLAWVATDERGEPVLAVGQQKRAIEVVKRLNVDPARRDELITNPIFNYARVFAWSQMVEFVFMLTKNAAMKADQGIPVSGSAAGVEVDAMADGRNGTVDEVIQYCKEGSASLETLAGTPQPIVSSSLGSPIWATGVWSRVALATVFALGLQWGTTGASIGIHYMMHPIGLGCRAISLLMYGISGTVSFLLLLASSILAHLSRPQPGSTYRYSRLRAYQNTGAILCRWMGKSLAIIAGLGILVVSFVQPLAVFNNCWCSTTTLDTPRQFVVFYTENFALEWGIVKVWVGCLVLAFGASFLFGFAIYLGTPRRR